MNVLQGTIEFGPYRAAHADTDAEDVRSTQPHVAPLKLVVHDADRGLATGIEPELSVRAVDSSGEATLGGEDGFVIYDNDVQALIDLLPGRHVVYLSRKPTRQQRDEIAAVCAALMVTSEMD